MIALFFDGLKIATESYSKNAFKWKEFSRCVQYGLIFWVYGQE